jgi:rubrerythrin
MNIICADQNNPVSPASTLLGGTGTSRVLMAITSLMTATIILILPTSTVWAASNAQTIEALKDRYQDEVSAHQAYVAYADRACREGYPNIAHLFKSLAASEGVHARNFKKLLQELKVDIQSIPMPKAQEAGSTRSNLKHATTVERDEIDHEYPAILKRIASEANHDAITSITYAWKAEQQHRDLIVKIYNAAKRWFGLLVGRIEGGESHYHVCSICGSTLTEIPQDKCPICAQSVSHYREVVAYPEAACKAPAQDDDW